MAYEPYYLKDVLDASAQKKFTVISTFAGGGGSSTGYRLAGGDVLLINEFVEEAIETYKANFPDTKVLVDDIKKYKAQDFLDMAGIKKGELDILDGSPPCSAFSVAGKREKGWDKEKVILMARCKLPLKIYSMNLFVSQKASNQKSLSLRMSRVSRLVRQSKS